jgi:hypothetical protein
LPTTDSAADLSSNNSLEAMAAQMKARIDELAPLVREHKTLTTLYSQLQKDIGQGEGSRSSTRVTQRGGQPTRGQQILDYIKGKPDGVAVTEVADHIGTAPNYAYAVVKKLEEAGDLYRESGRVYDPAVRTPKTSGAANEHATNGSEKVKA